MTNGEGHLQELGINSFGITSVQPEDIIREQAESLGELVLGQKPKVEIQIWQAFQQDKKTESK